MGGFVTWSRSCVNDNTVVSGGRGENNGRKTRRLVLQNDFACLVKGIVMELAIRRE